MGRILALFGLSLFLAFATAAPAEARHCQRGCYDRCEPRDCCPRRKICYPVYRYETRKVFVGYRYDCDGCRHPRYRYERVKIYAGKRCSYENDRRRSYGSDDDDAYDPGYDRSSRRQGPDYSGGDHAFPNYEGDN